MIKSDADKQKDLEIADRVRRAREMAGLSQGQISHLMETSVLVYATMERSGEFLARDIAKIAELCDAKPAWLLGLLPLVADEDDYPEAKKLKEPDKTKLLTLFSMMGK